MAAGDVTATLLALAGLKRLGRADAATAILETDIMLPAIAQGAVGIACRADDAAAHAFLAPLSHADTGIRIAAERAMLARLDGSCRTPIAGLARIDDAPANRTLSLKGLVAKTDGSHVIALEEHGPVSAAAEIGAALGDRLLAEAGPDFLTGE